MDRIAAVIAATRSHAAGFVRPFEVLGVPEHPHLGDAALRRGQDLEVAVAEDPPEQRLGQDRIVDLLERRVRRSLVDHAFAMDDPPKWMAALYQTYACRSENRHRIG